MPEPRELDPHECERLLRAGVVGRVGLSTPEGPHVIPVTYSVFEDTIVVRTAAYTVLSTYGPSAVVAFEIDHIDHERRAGWSVLARGRAWIETDAGEVARLRAAWQPRPWASGRRTVYVRIGWHTLTGRRLEPSGTRTSESPDHPPLPAPRLS